MVINLLAASFLADLVPLLLTEEVEVEFDFFCDDNVDGVFGLVVGDAEDESNENDFGSITCFSDMDCIGAESESNSIFLSINNLFE